VQDFRRILEPALNARASAACGGSQAKLKVLSLLYFPALEAGSAHPHAPVRSLNDRAHRAQVHVPSPFGDVMGVADIVSKLRPFAAHFAYACHDTNSRIESDPDGQAPESLKISSGTCSAEDG